jgi:hypothetical protein
VTLRTVPLPRRRLRAGGHFLVWVLFVLTTVGCAVSPVPVYEHDGERYGVVAGSFRERWWSYFERGTSYARGGHWREAIADYREAIAQRAADRRRARSYGLHFVDYFPNRELGIALLALGDYRAALQRLERALEEEPSARGYYFLDRAREEMLRRERSDHAPPTLAITDPTGTVITREPSLAVQGIARDDRYVDWVRVGDALVPQQESTPEVRFQQRVPLHEGDNAIVVEVVDLLGRSTDHVVHAVADFQGPRVIVGSVDSHGPGEVVLAGRVADASGVVRFTVGGQERPLVDGGFTTRVVTADNEVAFEAEDRAGNVTRGTIPLAPAVTWIPTPPTLVAASTAMVAGRGGGNPAPLIDLHGWEEVARVRLDRVYVDGSVSDDRAVTELSINGRLVLSEPGRMVFFGQFVSLAEGDNAVVVRAADGDGNAVESTLHMRYEKPEVEAIGSRAHLTALPFEPRGGLTETVTALANEDFLLALADRGRFRLVERERLDAVLAEQRLTAEGLADPDVALRVGRLITAELVLTGSAFRHREGLELFTRLINVETGTILATSDVFGTNFAASGVRTLCEGLAFKVEREFPLVHGWLVKRDGTRLITDLGRKDGVRPEMKIWLYVDGPELRHPVTGALLGQDHRVIGQAELSDVFERTSTATSLGEISDPADAQKPLRVVTR